LIRKGCFDDQVIGLSLRQPTQNGNPPMRDRLTLKSDRQPEQAADRQDFNPQTPGVIQSDAGPIIPHYLLLPSKETPYARY